jgi:hypothetical protein
MKATIEFENFDSRIKEIVREVLQEELMKLRASLLPLISDEEQGNIEELYAKPSEEVDRVIETDL